MNDEYIIILIIYTIINAPIINTIINVIIYY